MVEKGRAGLNCCSSFKAFRRTTNIELGCWSLFLYGILAAVKSNLICFQVTFIRLLTADWKIFWLFEVPLCLGSFPQTVPIHGLLSFPQFINELPKIITVLLYNWSQHRYQSLITGDGGRLEYLGFHSYSEYGSIRAFKEKGTDGLSHFQLLKNLLYLFCRLPGSHLPREILIMEPNLLSDWNNTIYKEESILNHSFPLPPWMSQRYCQRVGCMVMLSILSVSYPVRKIPLLSSPHAAPIQNPKVTITMLGYFPWSFDGTWQLSQ